MGPSSAFFTNKSDYNITVKPFLGQHTATKVFLEFGLGYYHQKINGFANLALRQNNSSLEAYGTKQLFKRKAITLELNKFLFDYKGFVPFIGLGFGYENLTISESELGESILNKSKDMYSLGINFGWDILPTKIEYMTLRTNSRYFPTLQLNDSRNTFNLQQLEFNFIQFVFYPQRFKRIRKLS